MNWTDEYREIIEFYYWEPQHLGRAAGPKKFENVAQMWQHVNGLEVSLNHILNIFFSLYGNNDVLTAMGHHGLYDFVSSRQLDLWQKDYGEFTQPDMFFLGAERNLAIELKLGSKTSVNQIAKYLVFNHCVASSKGLGLLLLSPFTDLEALTKEKFSDSTTLLEALDYSVLSSKLRALCSEQDFDTQLKSIQIRTLSLHDFVTVLESIISESQTERNLLIGTIEYLKARGF